jgi:hypothetical protein
VAAVAAGVAVAGAAAVVVVVAGVVAVAAGVAVAGAGVAGGVRPPTAGTTFAWWRVVVVFPILTPQWPLTSGSFLKGMVSSDIIPNVIHMFSYSKYMTVIKKRFVI